MIRRNKGITMISLVITVVILMILASITTYSGISTARDARYYNAVHEMKVMQAKVNEWYEENKNGETSEWDKGVLIAASGRKEDCINAYNIANRNNISDSDVGEIIGYKYFSKECISNELDIEGINYDFLINLNTRYVILVDGIEKDGVTFYSLGEIDGEQYNVKYNE